MSKFDFSDVSKGLLKLTVDGATYEVNQAGEFLQNGVQVPANATLYTKLNGAFGEAVSNFAKTQSTNTEQVNLVRGAFNTLHTNLSSMGLAGELGKSVALVDATKRLEGLLSALPNDKVADEAALAPIKKLLVEHPEAANILGAAEHNKMYMDTFTDAAGKAVRIIDHVPLQADVVKLRGGVAELANLYERGGYTQAEVTKIFLKSPKELGDVLPAEITTAFTRGQTAKHGVAAVGAIDIATIGRTAIANAEAHAQQVLAKAKQVLRLQEAYDAAHIKSGHLPALNQAKGEFAQLAAQQPDASKFVQVALDKGLTAEQKTAASAIPELKTTLSSIARAAETAGATAAKTRGWWTRMWEFKRTDALITEQAGAKGLVGAEAIEKTLGKAGEIRWGARVLPAALIAGAGVLACTTFFGGKKEETKPSFADRETERQAAAAGAVAAR